MSFLKIIIEFFVAFGIVFFLNYFLFIKNKVKLNKKAVPMELNYLIRLYNIDVKKINYKKFVYAYCLVNTFIISLVYIIVVYLVKGIIIQIIVGIVLLILLIIICYGLLGRFYSKESDKNV